MTFSAILEAVELHEVLHFLAVTGRTGRLAVARRRGKALVQLRRGKIVFAAADSLRESLGSLLVARGLAGEADIARALETQAVEPGSRLGEILVRLGVVSQDDVDLVVREQIERSVGELLTWSGGWCRFRPTPADERTEVEIDAADLKLASGVDTEGVLLRGLARQDEVRHHLEASGRDGPVSDASGLEESFFGPLRVPSLTAEVTTRILRAVATAYGRGVVLVREHRSLREAASVGLEPPANDRSERLQISVPTDQDSLFSTALETQSPYYGPAGESPWNAAFFSALGIRPPSEVALFPVVASGEVVLAIYADTGTDAVPMVPSPALELLAQQLGITLEQRMIDLRIEGE